MIYRISRELNIDGMKTEWVRVCVRPEQSFTRAILEIYMADGGSLGEVITALRKQKQFRIIQEISDQAEEFLDVYNAYHKTSYSPGNTNTNQHLYSILNTLFEVFMKTGQEDPLSKFQLYSGGFKSYLKNLQDPKKTLGGGPPVPDTDLIVNSFHTMTTDPRDGVETPQTRGTESLDSGYTSPFRYGGFLPSMAETSADTKSINDLRPVKTERRKSVEKIIEADLKKDPRVTIRILLIFAQDGAGEADTLVTGLMDFTVPEFPHIKVDMFRLNEVELWNQLLLNPEACLVKWLDEMDYVMPILTPQFLQVMLIAHGFIYLMKASDWSMLLGSAQPSPGRWSPCTHQSHDQQVSLHPPEVRVRVQWVSELQGNTGDISPLSCY